MLRVALVFAAIALAVTLTAPTIASVHDAIEGLDVRRPLQLKLWRWDTESETPIPLPTTCSPKPVATESEVTDWPLRMAKEQNVTLGGHVIVPTEGKRGLVGVPVDLFVNASKNKPGVLIGSAVTDGKGEFVITTRLPPELAATRYHIVAHAYEVEQDCKRFLEHWSDPEMDVTSTTRIELETPPSIVLKRDIVVEGRVLDSVDAPVRNERVQLFVGTRRIEVTTDDEGRFEWSATPERAGSVTLKARFPATSHYGASEAQTTIVITGEDVRIPQAETEEGLVLMRSQHVTLEGQVLLPPRERLGAEARITLEGFSVEPCPGCAPIRDIPLVLDPEGAWRVAFVVPPTVAPGEYSFTVSGGGLQAPVPFDARVVVPTTLTLALEPGGNFEERFSGTARLVDDRGLGVNGSLVLATVRGDRLLTTDAEGYVTFSADSDCGRHYARIVYNGTRETTPASTTQEVVVCPLASWLSPLGVPWWVWLAGAATAVVTLLAVRKVRRERAPVLNAGPPLTLTVETLDDEANGIVGQHEGFAVHVRLEAPLPSDHTLRVGVQGNERVVTPQGVQARLDLTTDRLGPRAVRAEILDARGRVVTRRTAWVRVVRYAEEIETRYRTLKREHAQDHAERISPREFEAWLAEHAPHIDADDARRLIDLFEEADYSPREATRTELLHYLRAEALVKGVRRHGTP